MKRVLVALAVLVSACGGDTTAPAAIADSLAVVSGTSQSGVAGAELAQPVVVRAVDAQGRPLRDVIVAFVVTGGNGSPFTPTVRSDGDGLAVNYWTLGTSAAASQTLEARTIGRGGQQVAAEFVATALAGPVARIGIQAGNDQTARTGRPVPIAPAVRVTDQYGNPVALAGVSVRFGVTGGAGTAIGAQSLTDATGVAALGSWILGPIAGRNTITATPAGAGISPDAVSFTAWGAIGDVWLPRPAMPTARYGMSAGVVGSTLYVAGGTTGSGFLGTLEAFDVVTQTWTARAPLPTARLARGVGVVTGIHYAVGGSSATCSFCNTVEAYDPTTNTWTPKAPMPTGRHSLAVAGLSGTLYAAGGQTQAANVPTLEAYDPTTNTWTTKAPMPTNQIGFGLVVIDGLLYAVGPRLVAVYDPVANSWTTKASMPTPRSDLAVGAAGGAVFAIGGVDPSIPGLPTTTATVERYDPVGNAWTRMTSMPTARMYHAAAAVGGVVYVVGGVTAGGQPPLATVEAYVP